MTKLWTWWPQQQQVNSRMAVTHVHRQIWALNLRRCQVVNQSRPKILLLVWFRGNFNHNINYMFLLKLTDSTIHFTFQQKLLFIYKDVCLSQLGYLYFASSFWKCPLRCVSIYCRLLIINFRILYWNYWNILFPWCLFMNCPNKNSTDKI